MPALRKTGRASLRALIIGSLSMLCASMAAAGGFTPPPALAAGITFRIDAGATEVSGAVAEPMSSIRGDAVGTFRVISGYAYLDPDQPPQTAWVRVLLDAASYHSGSSLRDGAVKSSVLHAANYPYLEFEGFGLTDLNRTSSSSGSARLKGQLTLHGTTQPMEVPVNATLSGNRLDAWGEFSFDYSDFGIDPPSFLGLTAGRMVKVTYHAIAIRMP